MKGRVRTNKGWLWALRYDPTIQQAATGHDGHEHAVKIVRQRFLKEPLATPARVSQWAERLTAPHGISIPRGGEIRVAARWDYRVNRINEQLAKDFVGPSTAPILLEPLLFADVVLNRDLSDDVRLAIYRVHSHYGTKRGLEFLKLVTAVLREEALRKDDADPRPMSTTALRQIPEENGWNQIVWNVWWALRAVGRKDLNPALARQDIRTQLKRLLSSARDLHLIPLLIHANERDFNDLADDCIKQTGDGRQADRLLGEVTRAAIHRGDYCRAEVMLDRLASQSTNAFAGLLYQYFSAHLLSERGHMDASDTILSGLGRMIVGVSDTELVRLIGDESTARYARLVLHVARAHHDIYAIDHTSVKPTLLLRCMRTCLENDYVDLLLVCAKLTGQLLEKMKRYGEALIVWHYLFDVGYYLDHGLAITWGFCGLVTCLLCLNRHGDRYDAVVREYFRRTCGRTLGMPARHCEVLLAYTLDRWVNGDVELAKQQLDKAMEIAQTQKIDRALARGRVLEMLIAKTIGDRGRRYLEKMARAETPGALALIDADDMLSQLRGSRRWFEWVDLQFACIIQRYAQELQQHYT